MSILENQVVDDKAQNTKVADSKVDDLEDDDEGESTEKGGDLKVALQQERSKRKEAARKAKELEETVNKIKPLAEEYEALLPYLPTLLANNDKKVKEQENEELDEEAREYAEIMGIEDADGHPDVRKARKQLDFMDRRLGRTVDKKVAPAVRGSAQAQANEIIRRAYNVKDKDGRLYATREAIDKVFRQMAPEQLLNPDNALAALIMARGLGGPGEEEAAEPIYTERPGRSPRKKTETTELGKALARIRGKSEKQWSELSDNPMETGWDLE